MDDNSFDKIIKSKAEGFKDQGHDPQALADMRSRLSNIPATSFSKNWGKPAAMAAALLLFTLANLGIVWYFSESRHQQMTAELMELKAERSQLLMMQEDLMNLRSSGTDTVYLYRDNAPIIAYQQATSGIPSQNYSNLGSFGSPDDSRGQHLRNHYRSLGSEEELSEELATFLAKNNLLLFGEEGNRILMVKGQAVNSISLHHNLANYQRSGPDLPKRLPRVWDLSELSKSHTRKTNKLSSKTLWALEKHQYSGIDFQFGAEALTTRFLPEYGEGDFNTSIGLLTEVIFSPLLRLETGIHFGNRSYAIKEKELAGISALKLSKYPGYDAQTGQLIRLESDAQIIRIPVNLKLMGVLDHNKRWYLSAGISPQWLTAQEFDYQYAVEGPSNPDDESEEFRMFIGTKQEVNPGFNIGTFNVGIGTEVYLNELTRWQIGAFYERNISNMGAENINAQGIGLKTSFWLNRP